MLRKKPILLHYYITNRCNSRCRFCTIWSDYPKYDANVGDVAANLEEARRLGCKFVDFTGGEPLLHTDLPVMLRKAKSFGFITSVTTNCLLFPEKARDLNGMIDLLHFSLDAGNALLHDEIRGSRSFNKVIESIPLALQNNMVPDLLFTYTDYNIDSVEDAYEIARKNRLMLILDPVFSTTGPDSTSPATHRKALRLSRKKGVYLNKAHLILRSAGGNHIRNPVCRAVQSTIVISPENKRLLPCFHHRMHRISASDLSGMAINPPPEMINALEMQGRYPFCEGCHINCYFDPSFNYMLNLLFFQSLAAKFSYIIMKYFIYRHFRSFLRLY